MAGVKKGTLTRPPQWWKHLRDWKRVHWKRERKAQGKAIRKDLAQGQARGAGERPGHSG